jgi:hypothetical protein
MANPTGSLSSNEREETKRIFMMRQTGALHRCLCNSLFISLYQYTHICHPVNGIIQVSVH